MECFPGVRRIRETLLASARLSAHEITMPVLDLGRGKTKEDYAWEIARDDRPWSGTDPPAAVLRYAPGRRAEQAQPRAGYTGILQCDGSAACKGLTAPGEGGEPGRDAGILLESRAAGIHQACDEQKVPGNRPDRVRHRHRRARHSANLPRLKEPALA